MRVKLKNGNPEFADFLIQVGDGTLENADIDVKTRTFEQYLQLPPEWNMDSDATNLDEFIDSMNMNEQSENNLVSILTPKNVNMHEINSKCIKNFPGKLINRLSIDSACLDNDDLSPYQISTELLNTLPTPSGMAPHKLELKKGCPLVILKNLNVSEGLCNGTRCILVGISRNYLTVQLLHNGKIAAIPRITMTDNETYGFTLKRHQFAVQLCFAMSINKAQVPIFIYVFLILLILLICRGTCCHSFIILVIFLFFRVKH